MEPRTKRLCRQRNLFSDRWGHRKKKKEADERACGPTSKRWRNARRTFPGENGGLKNGIGSSTPTLRSIRSFEGQNARRYGNETFGHWGDIDESEEDEIVVDWEARVAQRNSLVGLKFPKGWEIPPAAVMKKLFRQLDFAKEMKRGTLKPFMGTLGDFPRFKAMFYKNVPIQEGSVLAKCEALDALLPDELVARMFFGLSVSGVDCVTRIERLVRRFDREDVYRDNLLKQSNKLQTSQGESFGAGSVCLECIFQLSMLANICP